jgi:hypothetical protein|tara:strand:+ start:156 stop:377 length:222 start_codon:yes stop_codon:yes gene_type:complete
MKDLKDISSEDLRQELQLRGYYTNNLWHVDDVMKNYNCTSENALEILDDVMQGEYVTSMVFDCIDINVEKEKI